MFVPLRLATEAAVLSSFSTTVDITLAELAIEAFFPADQPTAQALWKAAP